MVDRKVMASTLVSYLVQMCQIQKGYICICSAPSVMSTNQESPTSEATLKSATFQNIGTVNIYDASFSMTSHAVERKDTHTSNRQLTVCQSIITSLLKTSSPEGTQASPAKMHEAGPNVTSTSACRKSYTRPSTQERNKSELPTSAGSAAGSSRSQDLTLTPTTRGDQRPYKVRANNRKLAGYHDIEARLTHPIRRQRGVFSIGKVGQLLLWEPCLYA